MPIDRKGYRAAKKKYKSAVRTNKQIRKSNDKIDRSNERSDKTHKKTVKRADKKYEKSEARANKKDYKQRVAREKGYRAKEKKLGLETGSIVGGKPARRPSPKPMFGAPPHMMKSMQFKTGDKPKRSDYKGSKPQRATGSDASKMRMAKVIGQLNSAKMFMNTVSGKKRK